ncbi:ABC-type nickel/cobalt efflux system permease component RcnA [Clavibacter michiganensis]|uniref:hypothetical protein n=1 Tax=Clavibacter michiganensis TaxID=28447 RepID=UPI0019562BE1|nr:hypothetical protein [Clavibacter michiganensis]MBM7411278.1 ABC-type nickel/cobalt efflux system permease component RcnA [Clavibacter michiganensis]
MADDRRTNHEEQKEERALRGGLLLLSVTIITSLGLGLALVDLGGRLILDASRSGSVDDLGTASDHHSTLTTIQEQLLAIILFGGVVLALIGAILRAFAHNVAKRKDSDYVGKLFGLASLMFTLTGAMAAIDPGLQKTVVATFVLLIAGTTCAVVVVSALVVGEREYRKSM